MLEDSRVPPNFKSNTWKRDKSSANNAQEASDEEGVVIAKFTPTQYQQILNLLDKQGSQDNCQPDNR